MSWRSAPWRAGRSSPATRRTGRGSTASTSRVRPAAKRSPASATSAIRGWTPASCRSRPSGHRGDREHWRDWFPADWISESFPGQFRNWFYSLLAMSATLEETEPFKACFTYALLRDEHGSEMHKSKGNAIWFEDAADKMGVDVMRWMYLRHTPGQQSQLRLRPRRRGAAPVPHPDLERLLLLRQLRQHRRLAAFRRQARTRRRPLP